MLGSLKPGKARRTEPLGILGLSPYFMRRQDETPGDGSNFAATADAPREAERPSWHPRATNIPNRQADLRSHETIGQNRKYVTHVGNRLRGSKGSLSP